MVFHIPRKAPTDTASSRLIQLVYQADTMSIHVKNILNHTYYFLDTLKFHPGVYSIQLPGKQALIKRSMISFSSLYQEHINLIKEIERIDFEGGSYVSNFLDQDRFYYKSSIYQLENVTLLKPFLPIKGRK